MTLRGANTLTTRTRSEAMACRNLLSRDRVHPHHAARNLHHAEGRSFGRETWIILVADSSPTLIRPA